MVSISEYHKIYIRSSLTIPESSFVTPMADEPNAPPQDRTYKVLLAQNDPQDRSFTRTFLQIVGGYEVIDVADGIGVIKQIKQRPDIILLDTVAQGKFLQALEIIRRSKALQAIPIAIYSNEQQKLPECIKKGADGFIVKPTSPSALLAKLWKLLGSESQKAASAAGFSDKYKRDLSQIENLPTLPVVYTEVDQLCKNPDVSADQLSKVIETDPSISLKLLSLANSAFFGFSRKINSIRDAVSLLGNQTVQNTILNIAVFEATKDLENTAGLDKGEFWVHSSAVGSTARYLAEALKLDRPESYTAGIIHDMGKIIMDALYSDFYTEVLQKVEKENISILKAEEDVIGLDHGEIGKELCESWQLPQELIEAVAYHHRPSSAEKDSQIASLVNIGDAIARKLGVGSGGDATVPEPHPAALKKLDITLEQLQEWEEDIKAAVDRDKSILSILQK